MRGRGGQAAPPHDLGAGPGGAAAWGAATAHEAGAAPASPPPLPRHDAGT